MPRWSRLALERELGLGGRSHLELDTFGDRLSRVPIFACLAGALAVLAIGSWALALLTVTGAVVILLLLLQLPVTRRWQQRRLSARLDREAASLRTELSARLAGEQRAELGRLEVLVDDVRAREAPPPSGEKRTASPLVARLDALLVLFVDLALELRRVSVGVSMTRGSAPRIVAPDPTRGKRLARLRVRARARCLERIGRLESELTEIGELVRLVHEQSLASRVPDEELSRTVAEILDDAERAWQAHAEVDALAPRS